MRTEIYMVRKIFPLSKKYSPGQKNISWPNVLTATQKLCTVLFSLGPNMNENLTRQFLAFQKWQGFCDFPFCSLVSLDIMTQFLAVKRRFWNSLTIHEVITKIWAYTWITCIFYDSMVKDSVWISKHIQHAWFSFKNISDQPTRLR